MAKILYIHGFGSCGDSTKTRLLKAHFGADLVVAPDIKVPPREAIQQLKELIKTNAFDLLMGSSLGGFYATYLSELFGIRAVLINPSTQPFHTLSPYVGENTFWCSGKVFMWESSYLKDLKSYMVAKITSERYMLFLQTADEVLDYRVAQNYYDGAKIIVEEGGNHRFENLEAYLEYIEAFLIEC